MNVKVTTASKVAEKISDAPGILSVVTKDELARFGGTTLADILDRVPGLNIVSGYLFDRTMVAFPGDLQQASTSRHVLLLINGRPVREVQEGGIKSDILNAFPVNVIERIEVIKGPGSVLYGSEAFAGVINVITAKPEEGTAFSVSAVGGQDGRYGTNASAEIKSGDFSLVSGVRVYDKGDWPVTYTLQGLTGGRFNASQVIPDTAAGGFLDVGYKNLRLMASYDEWNNSYTVADYAVYGTNDWRKLFLDLGYKLEVKDWWTMDFHTTYNRSWLDASAFPNVARDSHEILGEWTNFIRLADRFNVTLGTLFSSIEGLEEIANVNPPIVVSQGSRFSYGGYAELAYRATDSLKFVGGFQANKIGSSGVTVVPRTGIIWDPSKHVNLKLLYGEAYRAPYINELDINHPGLLGNPNLVPEKVKSINVGLTYSAAKGEIMLSYFNNRQSDIIGYEYVPSVDTTRPYYGNYNSAHIQGGEIEGKYYLTEGLFATGSMLYQQSNSELGISNFGAKVGLSYTGSYGTLSLFDSYMGDVSPALHNSLNPSPGSYHLVSLHGELDLGRVFKLTLPERQKVGLILQGDNITNQEIWLPASGDALVASVPFNPGRRAYVGMRFSF